MAAGQEATLRELMERMGHSSSRAALIYQYTIQERDEAIAAGRPGARPTRRAGERARNLDRARAETRFLKIV